MSEKEKGALSRWSRLKRQHSAEAKGEAPAAEDTAAETTEVAALAPEAADSKVEEESAPLQLEDLPDIESLTYESDFTGFLREGVPNELRKLALKKLWRSNPVLANVDGLNDYDLDYTKSEVMHIAAESAADLKRGTKRKSAHDLRREERDRQRSRRPTEPRQAAERTAQEEDDDDDRPESAGGTGMADDRSAARDPDGTPA